MQILYDFARLSPLIEFSIAIFGTIFVQNKKWFFYLIGLILSEIITKTLKHIFKQLRPLNASHCSVLPSCQGGKYGMPSGHAMLASFTCFYWFKTNLKLLPFAVAVSLFISYSRVRISCHTYTQIIVGYILGLILGITL